MSSAMFDFKMAAFQLRPYFKIRPGFFRFYGNKSSESIRKKGLVLGVYTKEKEGGIALSAAAEEFNSKTNGSFLKQLVRVGSDLKKGGVRVLYCLDEEYDAISVVGLEKKNNGYDEIEELDLDREAARAASGVGTLALQSVGVTEVSVENFGDAEAAAEGAHLAVWSYQDLKSEKKRKKVPEILSYGPTDLEMWQAGTAKARAQNIARRLMETPANLLTPTHFAENAFKLFEKLGSVKVEAKDKKWAENQKMGAFLSVSQGSAQPPVFLELTYSGGKKDSQPVALVGKGVTFDSGGISIKPSSGMEEMRADMGGGACVLASVFGAATLRLPINIKAFIPLCENMPSSTATKPGDVVTAMNGKTIQVDNTDAEGRLILADALCYAQKFNPSFLLDIATLTGAMSVAVGSGATGVFTNSNKMWQEIHKAGVYTGDRVWRFPLWQVYSKRMTDFPSVDVNNVGKGKGGGACTAAAFLKEFVDHKNWLHLDMAGVMKSDGDTPYVAKGMAGRPTRTLIQLLKQVSIK